MGRRSPIPPPICKGEGGRWAGGHRPHIFYPFTKEKAAKWGVIGRGPPFPHFKGKEGQNGGGIWTLGRCPPIAPPGASLVISLGK